MQPTNKSMCTFRGAIATLLVLISSLAPAGANPAPIGSPGTALVPFSLTGLRGVSIADENLTIRDGARGKIPSPAPGGGTMDVPSVEYRATYKFDNQTGTAMTVRVGFPVIVYSELAGGSYGGFTSLRATYDQTRLEIKELTIAKPTICPTEKLAEILKDLKAAGAVRSIAESPDFVDILSPIRAFSRVVANTRLSQRENSHRRDPWILSHSRAGTWRPISTS